MSLYRIVLVGVLPDADRDIVAEKAAALFKISPAQAQILLSGGKKIVKRGTSLAEAAKYESALAANGIASIVELDGNEALEFNIEPEKTPIKQPLESTLPISDGAASASSRSPLSVIFSLCFGIGVAYAGGIYAGAFPNPLKTFLPNNSLENSLVIGKSKKADFLDFKERGGLQVESTWRGFKVQEIAVYHSANGLVEGFTLELVKTWPSNKTASISELKKSISGICPSNWVANNFGNGTIAEDPSGRACSLFDGGKESISFMAGQKIPTAIQEQLPIAQQQTPTTPPASTLTPVPPPIETKAEACVRANIEAVRKEQPDAVIKDDMLQEFEADCIK